MPQEHQTKEDIRSAARRLFAERGYNAVSMRDLAQEVGKRQGGIYNHFASKQAILTELMRENLSNAHKAVIEPLPQDVSAERRLEAFVRGHIRHNTENPDDIFIAYMELRSLEADSGDSVRVARDSYESALRNILIEGKETGAFTLIDPAIHTRSLLAMLSGVIVWYSESGTRSLDEVTECYVQAALQSVGATYTPPPSRKD